MEDRSFAMQRMVALSHNHSLNSMGENYHREAAGGYFFYYDSNVRRSTSLFGWIAGYWGALVYRNEDHTIELLP